MTLSNNESAVYNSLLCPSSERTEEHVTIIYNYLRRLEVFERLHDAPLRSVCRTARMERQPANHVLYRKGQLATCWYILISGSVIMGRDVYLPVGCFGKRSNMSLRRDTDCIVMQSSDIIVIDYPDVQRIPIYNFSSNNITDNKYCTKNFLSTNSSLPKSIDLSNSRSNKLLNEISNYNNNTCDTSSNLTTCTYNKCEENLLNYQRMKQEKKDNLCSNFSIVKVRQNQFNLLNSKNFTETNKQFLSSKNSVSSNTTNNDNVLDLPENINLSDDDGEEDEEDEESCPSHDSFQELRDNVRECLEKEPSERSGDDIATLMEFMQQMPALACLPLSIKRQLCLKMVFAIVPKAGTVIMQHGEKIDAWSVVVNGSVEHIRTSNGMRVEYKLGDCFGAEPNPKIQYQDGEMRTLVDDCEFVLVEHTDYCSIMNTLSLHIECEEDKTTGEVVREAERRVVGNQVELLVTKALPERLIQQLVEDTDTLGCGSDANFLDDFLLMYRVFIFEPTQIAKKLLNWFCSDSDGTKPGKYQEKVARIFLLWVNNHFNDFESDKEMRKLLDMFENLLEQAGMNNQLSLLNITCSVKSKPRVVTLTRSNRAQELPFKILCKKNNNVGQLLSSSIQKGIFISYVESQSNAEKNGLKRGDEIIEVNGQGFRNITLSKAYDLLKESTHLSLTVKSNLMGFKEMLLNLEDKDNVNYRFNDVNSSIDFTDSELKNQKILTPNCLSTVNSTASSIASLISNQEKRNTFSNNHKNNNLPSLSVTSNSNVIMSNSGNAGTIKTSMFEKLFTLLKGSSMASHEHQFSNDYDSTDESVRTNSLRASRSNPDISSQIHNLHSNSSAIIAANRHSSFSTSSNGGSYYQCEQAIKIYKSDQSFRYLIIYPDTQAKQIVKMALYEFNMNELLSDWSLCECTVTREGVIKQRRLPDDMQNLVERMGLSSRFYLKNNNRSENLIADDLAPEILKELKVQLYNLSALFLATQLTIQDFAVFASIEPTEYVNSLFKLEDTARHSNWPHLKTFETLFNREMWWVVTEVCCEKNVFRRSKLIKKFIKIARFCRDLRNFNSMFAIISGLEKPAVRRLAHSWERVSGKYMKMFNDIQQLMDPSRNMSKYRHQLQLAELNPPTIPIYPILRKDLIFAHEGNSTFSGKLVNFDKLRMIARLIRSFVRHSSVQYDVELMMSQMAHGNAGLSSTSVVRKFGSNTAAAVVAAAAGGSGTGMVNGILNATSSNSVNISGGQSSRKKLYERLLMIRKVKAYLVDMPYIDSETELDRHSIECEPPAPGTNNTMSINLNTIGSIGNTTALKPTKKRMPSPSPSSLSSNSNYSSSTVADLQKQQRMHLPKFGMESPKAVQKIMSLAQNSKIAHNLKSGSLPPLSASTILTINSFNLKKEETNQEDVDEKTLQYSERLID